MEEFRLIISMHAMRIPAVGMKQGVAVKDAAAAPTQEEFNALLKSLRDAGVIAK